MRTARSAAARAVLPGQKRGMLRMIYFLVFVGGLLLSSMQSLNGLLSGYLGLFGTSFAVHVIGGVPVSYTQLNLFPILFISVVTTFLVFGATGWTVKGPVSYTHLDVYKRQRKPLFAAHRVKILVQHI